MMGSMKEAAFGDQPYPLTPGFKTYGTSSDAAKAAASSASSLRELALAVIIESGLAGRTADEVAKKLNKSVLAIRPRIAELNKLKKIRPTGSRRVNDSGLQANVYVSAE